ncbi:hypothetical protein K7X08_011822 [Anisodus acutangulus]|uniref:Uncharacterized protein n=1 Tax=Anisodus acutangulus TaxID=402998 RepID=A0A9Q1MKR9_9SOLA|nr:hypothetical protein K7X08_011822 [Anisodus acutangulus]
MEFNNSFLLSLLGVFCHCDINLLRKLVKAIALMVMSNIEWLKQMELMIPYEVKQKNKEGGEEVPKKKRRRNRKKKHPVIRQEWMAKTNVVDPPHVPATSEEIHIDETLSLEAAEPCNVNVGPVIQIVNVTCSIPHSVQVLSDDRDKRIDDPNTHSSSSVNIEM